MAAKGQVRHDCFHPRRAALAHPAGRDRSSMSTRRCRHRRPAAAMAARATLLLLGLAAGVSGGDGTACRDDFLIREGTIIRTVDSRRRGAVFLNITEVSETARCLQACCDRAGCNAAIYDQKTRSCFLFDCGPLNDYRCLFTSHAQFVSATLRLSRGQLDLVQWGSQSQHEAELTSLKHTETPEVNKPEAPYQKTLEKPLKEIIRQPATPPAVQAVASRCSRFQFECHSGECIAIYNACDGIPQCLDGSDEAAELACPAVSKSEPTKRPKPAPSVSVPAKPPAQPVAMPHASLSGPSGIGDDSGADPLWERSQYHQSYPDGLQSSDIFSHRQQGVLSRLAHFPAAAAAVPHLQRGGQVASYPQYEKSPVYQPAPAFYDDVYQNWAGRLPSSYNSPYDPLPRYDLPLQIRPSFMDRRPPPDLTSSGRMDNLDQPAPPPGWQQRPAPGRETGSVSVPVAPEDRPLSVDHRPSPARPPPPSVPPAYINTTVATTPPPAATSRKPVSTPSTPPTTAPTTKAAPPVVDEVELSLSELRAQAALQSAESQGAAIVLTLGVLLTCVLVVLALCRLQCGRQSGRRGDRSRLAHDADYLVNGMYL